VVATWKTTKCLPIIWFGLNLILFIFKYKVMIKRILKKLKRYKNLKVNQKINKIEISKFGTRYGNWTVPTKLLNNNSICYLVGAGEDISFDIEITEFYNCNTFIFDPTPRAKNHYENLKQNISKNIETKIYDSYIYKISELNFKKINFYELGLWDSEDVLKFYKPQNENHVSHSIVNLQKTNDYISVKVNRLSNIMKNLNHNYIDFLKLDIEGAEYKVLDTIIEDKLNIKVICIEFDEAHTPLDNDYLLRITEYIEKLKNIGYLIIDIDHKFNFTFMQNSEYDKIK